MRATHFSRRPAPGAYSIERVFADVRAKMPSHILVTERRNTHLSQGVIARFSDAWSARRYGTDINHVVGDTHYLTYFLPKKRTILTVHDTIFVERSRGLKRVLLWFFWFWLPAQRTAWMTTISEESKRRLLNIVTFDPDRVLVIPNPVSSDFVPSPLPPRGSRLRLLHIGTKPNKNLERLVLALDGLKVELTVVGKMTDVQQELLERCDVEYRSLQGLDDVALRAEYTRADVLVFVSLDEGFGLPIVEAQASGRPVVTSSRAPMSEVAGASALLVNPEDAVEIRAAIMRLDKDLALCSDLVAKGTENVKRFFASAVAESYAELYQRVHSNE